MLIACTKSGQFSRTAKDWILQGGCEKFNTNLSAAERPPVKEQRDSHTHLTYYHARRRKMKTVETERETQAQL